MMSLDTSRSNVQFQWDQKFGRKRAKATTSVNVVGAGLEVFEHHNVPTAKDFCNSQKTSCAFKIRSQIQHELRTPYC